MKKKITFKFEGGDFAGAGQLITRNYEHDADGGWLSAVTYKVGYLSSSAGNGGVGDILLISIADGYTTTHPSIEALCIYLNEHCDGYHPTTKAELRAINDHQGNRFEAAEAEKGGE